MADDRAPGADGSLMGASWWSWPGLTAWMAMLASTAPPAPGNPNACGCSCPPPPDAWCAAGRRLRLRLAAT